jgi:DNA-binding HxlR family transcriptional regulator
VSARRSSCPINVCLETFGDRWSLLVIRDLMLRGYRTYKELSSATEGIATNILADRLAKLEQDGIITSSPDPSDGRKQLYKLTKKGIDLAPILMEMARWSTRHAGARGAAELVQLVQSNQFVPEVRKRWEDESLAPLLPPAPAKR